MQEIRDAAARLMRAIGDAQRRTGNGTGTGSGVDVLEVVGIFNAAADAVERIAQGGSVPVERIPQPGSSPVVEVAPVNRPSFLDQ